MVRYAPFALLLACAHFGTPPGPRFVEVQGTHFILLTDLQESEARRSLTQMENILAVLAAVSWKGESLPREKLRVVEFISSAELHRFASPAMSAFYQPVDLFGEPMLVVSAQEGGADNVVLKHEVAHALHGSFLPRSPRWFFEGLACYLETLRHDPAQHRYVLGEPSADRLQYLRYHGADYRRVLSLPTREAVLLSGQEGYAFQSASWMLVFYLANERPSELDDYVARLARREEAQSAFNSAFRGLAPEALAAEVERYFQYLRQDVQEAEAAVRYRLRYAPDTRGSTEVHLRAVPPADVQALKAELLFLSPGLPRSRAHLVEARQTLEEALRLDPSHPLALAVELALPESATAAPPLERIRAAAAARPGDYRSQILLAFAVGAERPEERRAALARAVDLAPENATVLNALAWHDVTHGQAAEAIPLATKAAALAPTRATVLDTLATALARSSRCDEAVRVEERAVELTAEHASSGLRKKLLARLDAMRAGCAKIPLDEE